MPRTRGCTCGATGWACVFEPDCPDALPADGEACSLVAQVCDYDNDVMGGEDVCSCSADGWVCAYQPPCPDAPPATGDACPAPAQECGYSTVMGGGDEIECSCTNQAWTCIEETIDAPPPTP